MKAKNVTLIITIIVLTAVVSMAGYAYFSAIINLNANIPAVISTTGIKPCFTSSAGDEINIDVNIETLNEMNVGNVVANDSSTVNISLLAGEDSNNVTCTYDVDFVWDSDPYTATTTLPITQEVTDESQEPKTFPFELSLQGKSDATGTDSVNGELNEINLDKLTWKNEEDKTIANVITGAKISNHSGEVETNITWTFTLNFYVLPTPQNKLMNKELKGHLEITNVVC